MNPEVLERIKKSSTKELIGGIEKLDGMLRQNKLNEEKYPLKKHSDINEQKDTIIGELHKRKVVDDNGFSLWLGAPHSLFTPELKH